MLERERADKERMEKEAAQKELAELKAKQAQEEEKRKNSVNGVVTNNTIGGKPLLENKNGGFNDFQDMVSTLRQDELKGDPDAKAALNALWLKTLNDSNDKPQHFTLEGNLIDGKARFVQKKSLPDSEQEDRELKEA
jgi:hypothetical protein